jgi:AraC-like DNA-binding protein
MSNAVREIAQAIEDYTDRHPGVTPLATEIEGLTFLRSDTRKQNDHLIYRPALCLVVQGAKCAILGEHRLDYQAGQALVVSVEMPGVGRVLEADPQKPYLGLILEFDPSIMRAVIEEVNPLRDAPPTNPGIFVLDLEASLAECVLRLVRLLDQPDSIRMLAPLRLRETYYWLLSGPHGAEIARAVFPSGSSQSVISTLPVLRRRFRETIRVEELAQIAHMSVSAFHRQFKALTLMSPLQYQKNLRLLEARRLLAANEANVESTAFQVGYESPSQFSREYSRMFGAPPRRDSVSQRALVS